MGERIEAKLAGVVDGKTAEERRENALKSLISEDVALQLQARTTFSTSCWIRPARAEMPRRNSAKERVARMRFMAGECALEIPDPDLVRVRPVAWG